ncbi:hypothetical protein [Actinoplanes couchii]|uniref:PPM-type phosphatase domain-containing protein n=1 Tax=Actinoplanes couchii TaxID=403638 RepID=A0ABQ3XUB0_9ACTN|nr:hypothetical protein [Actinoplanes couchii]MDR6324024.1 hypothetical protein [Actinoplanes couchii]GID62080.1 hypothetical protein Aco03nite_104840 [Actinoplanes couchii]
MAGGSVSGYACAARGVEGRRQLLLRDGIGHGPVAVRAAQHAADVFREAPAEDPGDLVSRLHGELGQTGGAAVAVAELDAVEARMRFAGMGDIGGAVVGDGESHRDLASPLGTAGAGTPEIRQDE